MHNSPFIKPSNLFFSQLLEVLLEFNESIHISPSLRYDLNMPGDSPFLPPPEPEIAPLIKDATLAKTALKEAKAGLASGNLSPSAYRQVEESIKRNKAFAPALQYSALNKVPHNGPSALDKNIEANGFERRLGYLTPEHETEHYLALDAKLGDEGAALQLQRMPDPPTFAERERDAALRNPTSVYNWLRRNQPQTLQDPEIVSEKSVSRPPNLRPSKRPPTLRKDDEIPDEDGLEVEPTPKNKRKRDEDTGFRPKGGSSRSKKKKDESTPTANRSTKKS